MPPSPYTPGWHSISDEWQTCASVDVTIDWRKAATARGIEKGHLELRRRDHVGELGHPMEEEGRFMAEPFLSEIRIMSFVFAPKGWALCNGQLLPINQNQALFSLLGTTFGGDGRVNFALPDLRGRTPIHVGSGHTLGERGGEQAHTLSIAELPEHVHAAHATTAQSLNNTNNAAPARMLAQSNFSFFWASASNLAAMAPNVVSNVGGSQAHLNMQPFLTLNFCIALQGIFPSPN
jgi:microcystin-dependent protein